MELRVRAEELRTAAGTAVDAGILGVRVRACERPLGRLPAEHGVLLGGQARPPLLVGQLDPRAAIYTTTRETATNCVAAAATTRRWKTSWKPRTRGNGFGHWTA